MPRKTSQAVKKDTAVDSKNEGGAPRRSGRAVTKQETSSGKEATRSRRSSTAAQTAASVADSKTPKGRSSVSSRRESTSPSDSRSRNSREGGLESPATRVKSTRRSTGRVNYKESDGEEEVATPKYDENFDSTEEFEESESDEKSKPRGKSKPTKAAPKVRGAKDKSKGARGRRGRPSKKKGDDDEEEEESDALEISDDSGEPEQAPSAKKSKATPSKEKEKEKEKEGAKTVRGRKSKTEVPETKAKANAEEKAKPSRRSSRAASNKEEPPKKRPSRSLQAKRYTEEDDDEIEEISETKPDENEEYVKPEAEGSRKRKRAATSEANKRLKEAAPENEPEEPEDNSKVEDADEKIVSDSKAEVKSDKSDIDNAAVDEPMEVDEQDSKVATETEDKSVPLKNESKETEIEVPQANEDLDNNKGDTQDENLFPAAKEKLIASDKQESVDSSENLDESMHSSDSEQESRAEHSVSSGLEDSQDAKESKKENVVDQKTSMESDEKPEIDLTSQSSESFQQVDDNSEESKGFQPSAVFSDQKSESCADKIESNVEFTTKSGDETYKNDSCTSLESKALSSDVSSSILNSSVGSSFPSMHSKEPNSDTSMNGSEKCSISNPAPVIHSTSSVIFEHAESPAPKANGAHDELHNSSVSSNDQYYLFPGRKYVINAKLSESVRQSVKDQTFGFVSYNMSSSGSDVSFQKDKLLNELNNLDAQIFCIQHVSKAFYSGILEPSLDALGFKGTFSQPEDCGKGMATFYKNSLFRLSGQSEASLRQLVERELEASSLDTSDRMAVRTYVKRCGHVLFTHFTSVIGTQTLTVANVQIPPSDLSIHALQVSCLAREVVRINGGTSKPLLLGGEFNMLESEAPYQLLRDGYLSNEMIEELQRRKDVALPGKENAALVNLLWKSFQHPSSNLCSCYTSVLDHEIFIPEQKITSADLLWYSSDSLYTVGALDIVSDKPGDHHHFSLKADMAFSV